MAQVRTLSDKKIFLLISFFIHYYNFAFFFCCVSSEHHYQHCFQSYSCGQSSYNSVLVALKHFIIIKCMYTIIYIFCVLDVMTLIRLQVQARKFLKTSTVYLNVKRAKYSYARLNCFYCIHADNLTRAFTDTHTHTHTHTRARTHTRTHVCI